MAEEHVREYENARLLRSLGNGSWDGTHSVDGLPERYGVDGNEGSEQRIPGHSPIYTSVRVKNRRCGIPSAHGVMSCSQVLQQGRWSW